MSIDLVMQLVYCFQKPSWRGYLNKSQLITEAQPYCDTSFTVVGINFHVSMHCLVLCPLLVGSRENLSSDLIANEPFVAAPD